MSDKTIERRLVFLFPGFEPMGVEAHIARFRRAAERSAKPFGVTVDFSDADAAVAGDADPTAPSFPVLACDLTTSDRRVSTKIVFCDWSDLIRAYAAKPLHLRVARGLAGLLEFIVSGTLFSYLRTSWRYGFFFAYPLVAILGAIAIGIALFATLTGLFAGPTTGLVAGAIAVASTLTLLWYTNRRWHLMTALDDWALASDMCRGRSSAIDRRIQAFAAVIAAQGMASDAEEIVIAAHSLGVGFAVPAFAKAFEAGFAPRVPVHMLTVGSSLMKTALHPKAAGQRDAVRRILIDHGVPWTDCQGLSDPINFYKSNPAASLGISANPMPTVVKVHFRKMVTPQTYRRIKRDFFRLHRQFVLAVETRCAYSFHMLLLGPGALMDFQRFRTVARFPLVASSDIDNSAPLHSGRSEKDAAE